MSDMLQKQFDQAAATAQPNLSATGPSLLNGVVTVLQQMVNGQAKMTVAINGLTAALQTGFPVIVAPPATSADPGVAGQVAMDGTYFYWCYAANSWLRVAGAVF